MIDAVSPLVPSFSQLKSVSNTMEGEGSYPVFMQLLKALAGSSTGATGASNWTFQAALLAAAGNALAGSGLVGELVLPVSGQEGEVNLAGAAPPGKREQDNSCAAGEVILALLTAVASQLRPWQLKASGNVAPSPDETPREGAQLTAMMGDLAQELLSLAPAERRFLLQQLSARQGAQPAGGAVSSMAESPGMEGSAPPSGTQPDEGNGVPLIEGQFRLGEKAGKGLVPENATSSSEVKMSQNAPHASAGSGSLPTDVVFGHGTGFGAPDPAAVPSADPRGFGEVHGHVTRADTGTDADVITTLEVPVVEKLTEKDSSSQDRFATRERVAETAALFHKPEKNSSVTDAATPAPNSRGFATSFVDASVIEQIARRAHLLAERGRTGMTIQLEPKELGKVRVHVSLGPDGLNIHLATETTGTREVIQASLPQLKAAFQSQGVRVDRFDVAVSSGFSNPAPPQHNAQQQAWSGARSAGYYPWEEDADAGGSESSEVRTQSSLVDYRI